MQIQSPSFSYQNPSIYGFQSYPSAQAQPSSQMQGFCGAQSQPDQLVNLLVTVLMRVLDFAFNLITQLTGQGQSTGAAVNGSIPAGSPRALALMHKAETQNLHHCGTQERIYSHQSQSLLG